jgi:hypothetical protein
MIRAIALDIDGTLLGPDKRISRANRAAIAGARARGLFVTLVTGRRLPAARKVAEDLGGDPPLVLHNGALIVDGAGAPVRVRPLAREVARTVVALSRRRKADPVVHVGQRGEGLLVVETDSPSHTLLAYYLSKSHPDVRVIESLDAYLAESEDPIQVMYGGSMNDMSALMNALAPIEDRARLLRTVYPDDDLSLIDVVDRDVDKAEALRFLGGRLEIPMEEILAIGDNWNDRDMLLAAGVGCVMGNADAPLRGLGLPVVPSNADDGVAWAIERYAA